MKTMKVLFALTLLSLTNVATARVLSVTTCTVEDPSAFAGAITAFHEAMSGGARPEIAIFDVLWNGASPATHNVVVQYDDYAAQDAFRARVRDNGAPYAQLLNSVRALAKCPAEGLLVERGSWGDPDVEWEFTAVYPISTTDAGKYAEALDDLGNSDAAQSLPAQMVLWENRAGAQGFTHLVVFTAPTLAGLNTFIDSFLSSGDYGDFVDDVKSIRTLGTASQGQQILRLQP